MVGFIIKEWISNFLLDPEAHPRDVQDHPVQPAPDTTINPTDSPTTLTHTDFLHLQREMNQSDAGDRLKRFENEYKSDWSRYDHESEVYTNYPGSLLYQSREYLPKRLSLAPKTLLESRLHYEQLQSSKTWEIRNTFITATEVIQNKWQQAKTEKEMRLLLHDTTFRDTLRTIWLSSKLENTHSSYLTLTLPCLDDEIVACVEQLDKAESFAAAKRSMEKISYLIKQAVFLSTFIETEPSPTLPKNMEEMHVQLNKLLTVSISLVNAEERSFSRNCRAMVTK